jgi:hypothetical protein
MMAKKGREVSDEVSGVVGGEWLVAMDDFIDSGNG